MAMNCKTKGAEGIATLMQHSWCGLRGHLADMFDAFQVAFEMMGELQNTTDRDHFASFAWFIERPIAQDFAIDPRGIEDTSLS
jgi:hypothetical protein